MSAAIPASRHPGPYELLEELGRGGMGVVYRAERRDLPGGHLAIKILRGSSGRTAERFAREQEILARLDHPAIVRFLDSGAAADGDPYYVMELVEGLPIDRYCDSRQLGLRERIELFLEVCAAVSHAHQHFVVHRDLKPSNVLVDREGRPRVLDFGIAKWLDGGESGQETTRGATPMTLLYASPEQVRGEPVAVGTDVYSLSVMLYELLAGSRPHTAETDIFELAIAIDRQEPPLASAVARGRGELARERELAGDLDAVLAKGLAKDPAGRFPSVAALADDLRRYLDHQPVGARHRSRLARAGYFVRRHPRSTAVVTAFFLMVAVAALVFFRQTEVLAREMEKAELARTRAEARVEFLAEVFAEADPFGSGPHATVGDALGAVSYGAERDLAEGRPTGSAVAVTAAEAYWRLGNRQHAVALATLALRSNAPMEAAEMAILLAIDALARPAPSAGDWSRWRDELVEVRRTALRSRDLVACELAQAWQEALEGLGGNPLQVSAAGELGVACALEEGDPAAAGAALARLEAKRADLPEDHPARRDLARLRAEIATASRPAQELP